MAELTAARLRELLNYDPETGIFYWREKRRPRIKAGDRAGTFGVIGYRQIIIEGGHYTEHRLAWLYVHGEWPSEIDHKNGVRDDNRIANLRIATRSQNVQNIAGFSTNRSGFKGVGRHNGRWRARIAVGCRSIWLGHFKTAEDAYAAYCEAAHKYHGEFARVA